MPNAIQSNHVNPVFYTNLNLAYDFKMFGSENEIFLNVNNLFDRKPPFGFAFNYGLTASPQYDVIGRMYKLGVRFKF